MTTRDLSRLYITPRYLLQRRVGAGGMATVYEALDTELDKRVAVKVLNDEWRSDEEQVGRFRQEARTAARLQHPHLVDVTDRGITRDGTPYLVMEFLEGKSLQQELIDRAGPMPWRRVVEIATQVCAALQAAHESGLVHRDVKPGNCFLVARPGQPGDFVKLLDLGIAKVVAGPRDPHAPPSTRTCQGTPGTPEYMSPEQVMGTPIDARSDLYSLGIMMWSMLAGRLPFTAPRGDPPWAILEAQVHHEAPGVRGAAPEADIPEAIEEIVARCLAKQPDDRYTSAAELASALRAAESAEMAKMSLARGLTFARTPRYRPRELEDSRPHRLRRRLVALQGTTLFMLSAMTLLLVELPGVEALAAWMNDSPPPPPPALSRPVEAPRYPPAASDAPLLPSTEPSTPPAVDLRETPPPTSSEAPPATSTTVPPEAPPVPSVDPPPPIVLDPPVVLDPPPPSPPPPPAAGPEVQDPFEEPTPKKTTPKPKIAVADPFKTEDPAARVGRFLAKKRKKFAECKDYLPTGGATFAVKLVLAPNTGKVVSASIQKGVKPTADSCVKRILETLTVKDVTAGGSFTTSITLTP